jgi:hypothetical protein
MWEAAPSGDLFLNALPAAYLDAIQGWGEETLTPEDVRETCARRAAAFVG